MKLRTLLTLIIVAIFTASCIKTKTCNLVITDEEKTWFVYDSSDTRYFENQNGDQISLKFSPIYSNADGEVSEDQWCKANAVSYINLKDSLGSEQTIGEYLLKKTEIQNNQLVFRSNIIFGDLKFVQGDYQDENLYLDRNGNALERLDSLAIGDSTYENVLTIATSDSMLFTNNQFKDIVFSEDFEILQFEIQDSLVYDLVGTASKGLHKSSGL